MTRPFPRQTPPHATDPGNKYSTTASPTDPALFRRSRTSDGLLPESHHEPLGFASPSWYTGLAAACLRRGTRRGLVGLRRTLQREARPVREQTRREREQPPDRLGALRGRRVSRRASAPCHDTLSRTIALAYRRQPGEPGTGAPTQQRGLQRVSRTRQVSRRQSRVYLVVRVLRPPAGYRR